MVQKKENIGGGKSPRISLVVRANTERYGLIYTDFRSQKRTIKDSGFWYSRVAASNRLDV
jgi:beta-glucosidase/6-phospho-beta-glucosidase/beta-galactosidase